MKNTAFCISKINISSSVFFFEEISSIFDFSTSFVVVLEYSQLCIIFFCAVVGVSA